MHLHKPSSSFFRSQESEVFAIPFGKALMASKTHEPSSTGKIFNFSGFWNEPLGDGTNQFEKIHFLGFKIETYHGIPNWYTNFIK